MKIIIVGAGEVGGYLCELLSKQAHDVTLIESSHRIAQDLEESCDARIVIGNGSSAEVLTKANVSDCDFFLAMTSEDRTNLISCSLAKALGAKSTIVRFHDQTYTDNSFVNYQLHFGADYMLNPEGLCAVELAKSIRNPGSVAVENFARGQIEVQQIRVAIESRLAGTKLKDLQLSTRIGYVQRNDELEVASANTSLRGNDVVTAFGSSEELFELNRMLDPRSVADQARVVLFGGSETAIALVRLLANPRYKIRIIEEDANLCAQLAEKFPDINLIHGNATSLRLLEEEHIGQTDYFVACTKRDEDNIMTGLQASKLGAPHVQLVINKPDYENVLQNLKSTLGVELMVSPRVATANEVLRYLSAEPVVELATLPNQTSKILEIRIAHDNPFSGRNLREIPFPEGCVVVALLHKFQVKVPGAKDSILGGDRIVIITNDENVEQVKDLLA